MNNNTNIYFTSIFQTDDLAKLCNNGLHIIIVTDDNVGKLYTKDLVSALNKKILKIDVITISPGEQSKTREVKAKIEDQMFSLGCGRDTLMIALGGGVVTDLTGYIAATYNRGIPVIYIPTSLLAMVDASIGGKTGINTSFGKNTLGTFTEPLAIFTDVNLLKTLPDIEYISALSEIIKHALIYNKDYFLFIESSLDKFFNKETNILNKLVFQSHKIKSSIVAEDKTEKNKREILNFGHTIAHAIEYASDYTLGHGHAVALGIIGESFISNQLGFLSKESFERVVKIICHILNKLPKIPSLSVDKIISSLQFDKKNRKQKNRVVLLNEIGKVYCKDDLYAHFVEQQDIKAAIDYVFQLSRELA